MKTHMFASNPKSLDENVEVFEDFDAREMNL
jgi:hypothetical protein